MKKHLILLNLLFSFTGCGYYCEDPDQLSAHYQTISVPYVGGDTEGLLTDALVKAISFSNQFTYAKGGELVLEGTVINDQINHVGWEYDTEPTSGTRIHRLVPNEGRREVTVQFYLTSSRTGKVLYGPISVTAHADFDFVNADSLLDTSFLTPTGARQSVLFFSLGQLDSVQGASNAVLHPLYRRLAYKIVQGIENISFNIETEQSLKAK